MFVSFNSIIYLSDTVVALDVCTELIMNMFHLDLFVIYLHGFGRHDTVA